MNHQTVHSDGQQRVADDALGASPAFNTTLPSDRHATIGIVHFADSGNALSTAGDISSVAAALFALLAIAGALRALWRRTLGRRRDLRRRLERLGCGAQLSVFETLLGEPATIRRPLQLDESEEPRPPVSEVVNPPIDVCLWVYPECYVQAFVDATSTVRGFSVTLRDRRFKPRFRRASLFDGRLGHTRLAAAVQEELRPDRPRLVRRARLAVRRPVLLRQPWLLPHLVAASSHAGGPKHRGSITDVCAGIANSEEWSGLAATQRFRRLTTVTTYAVIDDQALAARIPNFGPHGDDVRTLLQAP